MNGNFRPVLADSPAFGLEATIAPGRVQAALRRTGGAIALGVKFREMLPDNLLRRVALDALRAGVPRGHQPMGIEHVDCVVDDAVHQQSKLRFALVDRRELAQARFTLSVRGFCFFAVRDIGPLDKDATDAALAIQDRLIDEVDPASARRAVTGGE